MNNKRIGLCLLVSCLVLLTNTTPVKAESLFDEGNNYPEIIDAITHKNFQKALALLNLFLEKEPNDTFTLSVRSTVFLELGKVQEALDDIDTILAKYPTGDGMLLFRCAIKESQAENAASAMECYAMAARSLEQICSPAELTKNGTYVRLLILGGSPQAEKARKEYMEYLKTEDDNYELSQIKDLNHSKIQPLVDYIRKAVREANR